MSNFAFSGLRSPVADHLGIVLGGQATSRASSGRHPTDEIAPLLKFGAIGSRLGHVVNADFVAFFDDGICDERNRQQPTPTHSGLNWTTPRCG